MPRIDWFSPNEHVCYLKHPVNGRVLELLESPATEQFLRELRHDNGYLPATREEYRQQQERRFERQQRQKGVSA